MDGPRFDQFAKSVATRRAAARGLAAALAAGLAAALPAVGEADDRGKHGKNKKKLDRPARSTAATA